MCLFKHTNIVTDGGAWEMGKDRWILSLASWALVMLYLQVSFPRPGPLISLSEIVDY